MSVNNILSDGGDDSSGPKEINIKYVLSTIKTEFCERKSANHVFKARKILKATISFLISERKFTEKMDILKELLMSGLSDWSNHDIDILDGISIPLAIHSFIIIRCLAALPG
jgi:hypothetical protein